MLRYVELNIEEFTELITSLALRMPRIGSVRTAITKSYKPSVFTLSQLDAASVSISDTCSLPADPGLLSLRIKGKVMNLWGLYCAIVTFTTALAVIPFVYISAVICDLQGEKKVFMTPTEIKQTMTAQLS